MPGNEFGVPTTYVSFSQLLQFAITVQHLIDGPRTWLTALYLIAYARSTHAVFIVACSPEVVSCHEGHSYESSLIVASWW